VKAWSSINYSILSDACKVSIIGTHREENEEIGNDGRYDGCVGLEEGNGKSVAFLTHSCSITQAIR
jgi:hypothetical protein